MELEHIKKKASEGFAWAIKRLKEIQEEELKIKNVVKETTYTEEAGLDFDKAVKRYDDIMRVIKELQARNDIDEYEKKGFTIEKLEKLGLLSPVEVKIEYVEKPLKTSPEQLLYAKFWRDNQKEIEKSKDIEIKNQAKIEQALKRKNATCYSCSRAGVHIEVKNPSYVIEKNRQGKKRIIIRCLCDKCGAEVRSFGGFLYG